MNSNNKPSSGCNKANATCDKCQYNEAPIWDRVKLLFHLLLCNNCRKYRQKNKKLTSLLQQANFSSLNKNEKNELHHRFLEELNKSRNRK